MTCNRSTRSNLQKRCSWSKVELIGRSMGMTVQDKRWMRLALKLARRGLGRTSPNPMVGAVVTRGGRVLGQGWHHRAGGAHAEIEAFEAARASGHSLSGATLYVTLEPCSTTGRTPPCTEAIIEAGIRRVVVAATDPNPAHAGRGFEMLRQAGIKVDSGLLASEAEQLNWAFNHWVVQRVPWVTVKAAMTLDGKLADARGRSQWITGERARAYAMRLRLAHDAVLVGVRTVLADNPALTLRLPAARQRLHPWRRIILDSQARTPPTAKVLDETPHAQTLIVTGPRAPRRRVETLARRAEVWCAPENDSGLDLAWLLRELGRREVTALLVEGGGEVEASFLWGGLTQRIAFLYAPKILGGGASLRAVAGRGATDWQEILRLGQPRWRRVGDDWLVEADILKPASQPRLTSPADSVA